MTAGAADGPRPDRPRRRCRPLDRRHGAARCSTRRSPRGRAASPCRSGWTSTRAHRARPRPACRRCCAAWSAPAPPRRGRRRRRPGRRRRPAARLIAAAPSRRRGPARPGPRPGRRRARPRRADAIDAGPGVQGAGLRLADRGRAAQPAATRRPGCGCRPRWSSTTRRRPRWPTTCAAQLAARADDAPRAPCSASSTALERRAAGADLDPTTGAYRRPAACAAAPGASAARRRRATADRRPRRGHRRRAVRPHRRTSSDEAMTRSLGQRGRHDG